MNGYIGVDLDGTLAEYDKWEGAANIGKPIPKMVDRVKKWLAEGMEVRIITARVWPLGTLAQWDAGQGARLQEAILAYEAILRFCREQFGQNLTIQCYKDFSMIELYDDRAKQVIRNTGELLEDRLAAADKARFVS